MSPASSALMRAALTEAAAMLATIREAREVYSEAEIQAVEAEIATALAAPAYHVPGPYEIALAIGAALAGSGRFETPGAAMAAAWLAIPEFYQARDTYLLEMVPAIYGGLSPREGAAHEPEPAH